MEATRDRQIGALRNTRQQILVAMMDGLVVERSFFEMALDRTVSRARSSRFLDSMPPLR